MLKQISCHAEGLDALIQEQISVIEQEIDTANFTIDFAKQIRACTAEQVLDKITLLA